MKVVSGLVYYTKNKVPITLHINPPTKPSTVLLGLREINLVFPKVIPAKKAHASFIQTLS